MTSLHHHQLLHAQTVEQHQWGFINLLPKRSFTVEHSRIEEVSWTRVNKKSRLPLHRETHCKSLEYGRLRKEGCLKFLERKSVQGSREEGFWKNKLELFLRIPSICTRKDHIKRFIQKYTIRPFGGWDLRGSFPNQPVCFCLRWCL